MKIPDDVFVCNCAHCGRLLIGEKSAQWRRKHRNHPECPPLVKGHIQGRPWCGACLEPRPTPAAGMDGTRDPDPSRENAVRALEDAPQAFEE